MLYIKSYKIVQGFDPVKTLQKEIIRFENMIFDPFHGNFRFSIVHNSSTRHPFQSNWITDVWRIYRGKGFVLGLFGKDALLASYRRLKMPFCPLSLPNGTPIGARSYYDRRPIGVRLATNWHPIGHHSRLSGSIGAGLYYFIILLILSSIYNEIVDRFTFELKMSFRYIIAYTNPNKRSWKEHDHNHARRLNTRNSSDVLRVELIESNMKHRSS